MIIPLKLDRRRRRHDRDCARTRQRRVVGNCNTGVRRRDDFRGRELRSPSTANGEVVFNTAITGYQEIFTDPSYCGQIVVLTYPQIGNYGSNLFDSEAGAPYIEGLVVREISPIASNWRSDDRAEHFLAKHGIPVIAEVDTRRLVRHLRSQGALRGVIGVGETDPEKLVQMARQVAHHGGTEPDFSSNH